MKGKTSQRLPAAAVLLAALYSVALLSSWIAPAHYQTQFRAHAAEAPSRGYPLGVDELGRDRLSRLLYGSQVSLLLAPAAALLATALAACMGLAAALLGSSVDRLFRMTTDLLLSLPLLFLLLMVRGMLPLNTPPMVSVAITFSILAVLGWPAAARVVRSAALSALGSTFVLQARAAGLTRMRLFLAHLLPNLRPVLSAQFLILIPVFIIGEANLGLLGLGVSEPLPSWGGLLAELQYASDLGERPWLLAPALLLFLTVISFATLAGRKDPA